MRARQGDDKYMLKGMPYKLPALSRKPEPPKPKPPPAPRKPKTLRVNSKLPNPKLANHPERTYREFTS